MDGDLLKAIASRRSVRKLRSDPVPEAALMTILDAARWAPSAHNAQPWRFVVVRDDRVKKELAEAMVKKWAEDMERNGVPPSEREARTRESVERFTKAPVLIVACLTMEGMDKYEDDARSRAEYIMAVQSVACAIENLLLAAHVLGLGACWYCAPLFCPDAIRSVLAIPSHVEPQALIAVGFPAEKPNPPPRYPLDEVVHFDRWGR